MGWRQWDRTNKVVVVLCAVVAAGVVATFGVLALRTAAAPPELPLATVTPEAPSASSEPTYECTTATGPDCTKDLADKEAARDKAYADAEAVFREYIVERDKVLSVKSPDKKIPEPLKELLTGRMQNQEDRALTAYKETARVYFTGQTRIKSVKISPNEEEWPSSKVTFLICLDASKQYVLRQSDDEHLGSGGVAEIETRVVEESGGRWMVDSRQATGVKKC